MEEIYNIEEVNWKNIFLAPFNTTPSTTSQWFQLKIIHRILPTRKYLNQINAIDSPLCLTCRQDETITHMLWSCPETQTFLNTVKYCLLSNNKTLPLIEELFIFNLGENMTNADLTIILETKYYISQLKD